MNKNTLEELQIEEIKEHFAGYSSIGIRDFATFYEKIYGTMSRNAVNWKIYELKKNNIIRHLSRGQYVLQEYDKIQSTDYVVFIMDIMDSTAINHLDFDQQLQEKVNELNGILRRVLNIESDYYVSQGDSIQILLPLSRTMDLVFLLTLAYLRPYKVRYGLGIGQVDSTIKSNSWEMNGPIFWNARDGLSLSSSNRQSAYNGGIKSGHDYVDTLCNQLLPLVNTTLDKITQKQWDALKQDLGNRTLQEALLELNISKTSYYERLNSSNTTQIKSTFNTIYDLLSKRKEISLCQ